MSACREIAHLDVIGAKMNSSRVSTKGLPHDIFKVPTYSGHYHTPSQYGNVCYIGFPRAPSGDKSRLNCTRTFIKKASF